MAIDPMTLSMIIKGTEKVGKNLVNTGSIITNKIKGNKLKKEAEGLIPTGSDPRLEASYLTTKRRLDAIAKGIPTLSEKRRLEQDQSNVLSSILKGGGSGGALSQMRQAVGEFNKYKTEVDKANMSLVPAMTQQAYAQLRDITKRKDELSLLRADNKFAESAERLTNASTKANAMFGGSDNRASSDLGEMFSAFGGKDSDSYMAKLGAELLK